MCWAVRLVVFAAASVAPKIKTRHQLSQIRICTQCDRTSSRKQTWMLQELVKKQNLNAYNYFIVQYSYCTDECSYQAVHYAEAGCKMGLKYRS
jgi:hypothetical protein